MVFWRCFFFWLGIEIMVDYCQVMRMYMVFSFLMDFLSRCQFVLYSFIYKSYYLFFSHRQNYRISKKTKNYIYIYIYIYSYSLEGLLNRLYIFIYIYIYIYTISVQQNFKSVVEFSDTEMSKNKVLIFFKLGTSLKKTLNIQYLFHRGFHWSKHLWNLSFVSYCTALYYIIILYFIVMYCLILYCIELNLIVSYIMNYKKLLCSDVDTSCKTFFHRNFGIYSKIAQESFYSWTSRGPSSMTSEAMILIKQINNMVFADPFW